MIGSKCAIKVVCKCDKCLNYFELDKFEVEKSLSDGEIVKAICPWCDNSSASVVYQVFNKDNNIRIISLV